MNNENKTNINWYPGHMVKAKREIKETLKLIDVVVELLDARIPISSQNPDIDQIVGTKPRIVVLNKSDLVETKDVESWKKYFENQNKNVVIVDSISGKGIKELKQKCVEIMRPKLDALAKKGVVRRSVRASILGIPNVGKSSLINKCAGKNVAKVQNKPGVTKANQWIRIDKNVDFLDTPGVLWPKFEDEQVSLHLAYIGTIKDNILDEVEISKRLLEELLQKYKDVVCTRYKLEDEELKNVQNSQELLELIAKKRGCVISGGEIDYNKISNIILDEFRSGKLGKLMLEKVLD